MPSKSRQTERERERERERVCVCVLSLRWPARAFQADGPAWLNARPPYVDSLTRGTYSWHVQLIADAMVTDDACLSFLYSLLWVLALDRSPIVTREGSKRVFSAKKVSFEVSVSLNSLMKNDVYVKTLRRKFLERERVSRRFKPNLRNFQMAILRVRNYKLD